MVKHWNNQRELLSKPSLCFIYFFNDFNGRIEEQKTEHFKIKLFCIIVIFIIRLFYFVNNTQIIRLLAVVGLYTKDAYNIIIVIVEMRLSFPRSEIPTIWLLATIYMYTMIWERFTR